MAKAPPVSLDEVSERLRDAVRERWRDVVRERRAEKILRFAKCQARERQWIRLSEIAERYGRERSTAAGYAALQTSILGNEFVEHGRSQLL